MLRLSTCMVIITICNRTLWTCNHNRNANKTNEESKKESCLSQLRCRTADIVRREVTTIAKKKRKGSSGKVESTQHIIDSGIIPIPKHPTAPLPLTRRYTGGQQA